MRKAVTAGKKAPVSKSKKCGLLFPVGRIHRLLKTSQHTRVRRISTSAAAYLTAVLEYLTSEVVDLSGAVTKNSKLKTIRPRSIMLAVAGDEEFFKLLSKVVFPFSGTSPLIYPMLLGPQKCKGAGSKSPRPKSAQKAPVTKVLHSIQMPLGQCLEIVQTDITALTVDAVVNPTNSSLYMGGMVGSRLMEVGGPAFAKVMADASTDVSHLQKNDAFITKGTGTKAKYVIHINGPVWNSAKSAECMDDLRACIRKCLEVAGNSRIKSMALPSVGTGRAKFPKALAAEAIVRTIKTYLDQSKTTLVDVKFVLYDKDSIDAYVYELNRGI